MTAHPVSCTGDGRSPSASAEIATVVKGWISSSSAVSAAGWRGSENVISDQPSTCGPSASSSSHP